MLNPFVSAICLFLALHISAQQGAEKKLRYVQAIWRHGDRAPKKKPYEADIYAVDRAIESAQSLLSGMFPPSATERFVSSLNWQPIPVHSGMENVPDPLLRPSSFACPHYQRLRKEVKEELEDELMPKYKEFGKELRPILNIPEDQPVKFRAITELKSIQMEIFHNLTQPDWVYRRWPKYGNKTTLELVLDLRDKERVAEFNGRKELARLSGGYLLGDWLKRAKRLLDSAKGNKSNSSNDKLQPMKMVLYSAHDGTLLALLSSIPFSDLVLKMPPFAACIIMEIYESKAGLFVEFFYRRNGLLEPLAVSGCAKSCPLEKFMALTKNNAIFDTDTLYDGCGAKRCVAASHSPRNALQLLTIGLCLLAFFRSFNFISIK